MKNNLLIITSLLILSACASNYDKDASANKMSSPEAQNIRNTLDPQPAINEHINDVNRNVGTVNSLPKI